MQHKVNCFIAEDGFGQSTAVQLLSPTKVANLIMEPLGCGEQTMIRMSPTALSIRYLDKINGWLELEAGSRDKALVLIEKGVVYESTLKPTYQSNGSKSETNE